MKYTVKEFAYECGIKINTDHVVRINRILTSVLKKEIQGFNNLISEENLINAFTRLHLL